MEGQAGTETEEEEGEEVEPVSPITPAISMMSGDLREVLGANAWDENPQIQAYMAGLQRAARAARAQVISSAAEEHPDSPTASKDSRQARRDSLILTDFPDKDERPSLPVTPAPRGRTFWGRDKEEQEGEDLDLQEDWVYLLHLLSSLSTSAVPRGELSGQHVLVMSALWAVCLLGVSTTAAAASVTSAAGSSAARV